MNVLPNESVILETDGGMLVLTTHRVRWDPKKASSGLITSIMLEEVCSCQVRYTTYPALFAVAALAIVAGAMLNSHSDSTPMVVGVVVAIVCVVAFLVTRRKTLSVRSAAGSIEVSANQMALDNLRTFIDSLESAKSARWQAR